MPPTKSLMNNYGERTIAFEHGEGSWLFDDEGNKYLDAICGIGVTGLGHAHPQVTKTITEQAGKLIHTSNLFNISAQEALADTLCDISGMDKVFFGNSGAEANEAAIKLARLHGHKRNIDSPAIVVMENSFHGRTLATLSATGNRKVQAGFEPLVQGFVRAPYNDINALENIAKHNPNVTAILVEPIQGEAGIIIPDDDYLTNIRALCDANDWLMMLDEIQTGNGRTGAYFAYQHDNIIPDVVTVAKGIANGLPISACLAKGAAAELFEPGNHGSTYGGNPLCSSTAKTVVDIIVNDNLAERANHLGTLIGQGLVNEIGELKGVKEIRYKGLMIAIEFNNDCSTLVAKALAAGLLINVTAGKIVRLLPPLILNDDQANKIVDILNTVIRQHLGQ